MHEKDFKHAFDPQERLTELVTRCFVLAQPEEQSPIERWQHFSDLADFALAMKVTLNNLNNQSFNNFMLRIGMFTFGCVCMCKSVRKHVCWHFLIELLQVSIREEFWLESLVLVSLTMISGATR